MNSNIERYFKNILINKKYILINEKRSISQYYICNLKTKLPKNIIYVLCVHIHTYVYGHMHVYVCILFSGYTHSSQSCQYSRLGLALCCRELSYAQ